MEKIPHDPKNPQWQCKWCGKLPIREILDGDALCQECCNAWVRGQRDD